ncbi:MAG: stage III sporulation protein AG [Lachnospiraceae bacterium]|nr:stage III sporulation protein AG [Lachnospiraceae bacterium]
MSEKGKKIAWKDIGINKLLIMLAAGVLLIILSVVDFSDDLGAKKSETEQNNTLQKQQMSEDVFVTESDYEKLLEKRLKSVLELVKNVGKAEVMITVKASGERIALVEKGYTGSTSMETDSQGGSRDTKEETSSEVVIYEKSNDGSMVPYVVKEKMPEIEGVVVIAEGGGNLLTANNIIEAVMALFDVPIHKIKVLEMKLSS